MKLVIIDYGLCNLLSVYNALKFLKVDALVTSNSTHIKEADAVILPGVGAFEDGMKGLRAKNLIEPIKDYVRTGKPFLGICLGMQMLMSKSYEFGEFEGLNLIPGEVSRFKDETLSTGRGLKIPHVTWNELHPAAKPWEDTILEGLHVAQEMYFVHSYYVCPENSSHILAQTSYGTQQFCSVVQKDNVYGCQFHPEKSSGAGLKILLNFAQLKQRV